MSEAALSKRQTPFPSWSSLGIMIFAAIAVVAWNLAFPSATIHYRLTLNAEVDGKPVSASSVVEVHYFGPTLLEWIDPFDDDPRGPHADIRVRGEALALKLGDRGYLFATLAPVKRDIFAPIGSKGSDGPLDYPADIYAQAIVPRAWGEPQIRTVADYARLRRLPHMAPLRLDKLPLLIRFRDISRPETVVRVDPNDLAASLGPGVRLVSATVELTDAPVTDKIETILPWLADEKFGSYLVPGNGPVLHKLPPEDTLFFDDIRSP